MHKLNSNFEAYTLYVHFYTNLDFRLPLLSEKEQGSFYNQQENQQAVQRKWLKQAMTFAVWQIRLRSFSRQLAVLCNYKKMTSLKGHF